MKKLIPLLFLSTTLFISLACKCGWSGNFIRVAPHQDLVVKVKVLSFAKIHSDMDEKMTVEIQTVFKGAEKRKKINVIGDDGMSCRPYISTFKKDKIYYLGLQKEGDEYEISVCGEYWLLLNEGKVKMGKNDGEEEPKPMKEKEFEDLLIAKIKS